MKLSDLSFKIFFPQSIADSEVNEFNQVYDLWFKVWVETRQEVDPGLHTPSDSFSRQDEIVVIYHQNIPIGMQCHRYVDTHQNWVTKDSYFMPKLWPEEAKEKFLSLGRFQILGSHIFIDPKFRKSASGLATKDILCTVALTHVYGTSADALVGMMRKDRGLSGLFYRMGAICLHPDVFWYQIPVDITAFLIKEKPLIIAAEYKPIVDWARKNCTHFEKDIVIKNIRKGDLNEFSRNAPRSYKTA